MLAVLFPRRLKGALLNSGPENLANNMPSECQYSGDLSKYVSAARPIVVIFFTLVAMFFISFPSSAQAHGIHSTGVQLSSASSVDVAVQGYDLNNEKATDLAKGRCGTGCCSMSGCDYVPFKLPVLVFPKNSSSVGYFFNYLPWARNPLDSLRRPPRSLS